MVLREHVELVFFLGYLRLRLPLFVMCFVVSAFVLSVLRFLEIAFDPWTTDGADLLIATTTTLIRLISERTSGV